MDGFLVTQLLHTVASLGVADVLADGPMSGPAVAHAVGADPDRLTRVLRALAAEGVVSEEADGTFALTPSGELLRRDVPGSMRALAIVRGELYAHAAGELLAAVRGAATPFELAYGEPFFAHLARDADHGAKFGAAMAGRAEHEAEDVVAAYDFGDARRVVDIGGGHGVLLSAVLEAVPEATGVLVDTAATLPAARERLRRAGLNGRCQCVEGDFFAAVPGGGDRYVLSR